MGVETENYDIAAKRFENTFRALGLALGLDFAVEEHRRSF